MPLGSPKYIYEIARDNPSAEITLFEVDLTPVGETLLRYYSQVNEEIVNKHLWWQGNAYYPFPVGYTPGQYSLDKPPERPTLTLSNIGGLFGGYAASYDDLIGIEVTIFTTYVKFLDAANFPAGNPDAQNTGQAPETYRISRKLSENKRLIEFELGSPFDFNTKFPARSVNPHTCIADYRDADTCGYTGPPITDANGNYFATASLVSRGAYNPATTYATNDWVTLTVAPKMDLSSGFTRTIAFVSIQGSNTGNHPLSSPTWWTRDTCVKCLDLPGCAAHFNKALPLPFNGFPGINSLPRF